jgi:hypothetical protein
MTKKTITIKEFVAKMKSEWNEQMRDAHEDDQMSFWDWISEWTEKELRKEHGIFFDQRTNEWAYDESNQNWVGDDVCEACGCYYNMETTDSDLCEECEAEDF